MMTPDVIRSDLLILDDVARRGYLEGLTLDEVVAARTEGVITYEELLVAIADKGGDE